MESGKENAGILVARRFRQPIVSHESRSAHPRPGAHDVGDEGILGAKVSDLAGDAARAEAVASLVVDPRAPFIAFVTGLEEMEARPLSAGQVSLPVAKVERTCGQD